MLAPQPPAAGGKTLWPEALLISSSSLTRPRYNLSLQKFSFWNSRTIFLGKYTSTERHGPVGYLWCTLQRSFLVTASIPLENAVAALLPISCLCPNCSTYCCQIFRGGQSVTHAIAYGSCVALKFFIFKHCETCRLKPLKFVALQLRCAFKIFFG